MKVKIGLGHDWEFATELQLWEKVKVRRMWEGVPIVAQ